jgi:hypothetical protein
MNYTSFGFGLSTEYFTIDRDGLFVLVAEINDGVEFKVKHKFSQNTQVCTGK